MKMMASRPRHRRTHTPTAEPQQQPFAQRELVKAISVSDGYLSLKSAAEYLDAKPRGFDQFVRKHGVPYVLYGRCRRFKKSDLDKALKTLSERQRDQRR